MEEKKLDLSVFLRIVSLVVVLIVINIFFMGYIYKSNRNLIQNAKNFLQSYSYQKLEGVERVLEEGLDQTKSLAHFYSTELSTRGMSKAKLQRIQYNSNFDTVKYIDLKGKCYTSTGEIYYDTENEMYKDGINGNSNIYFDYYQNSKSYRAINYYAPIYYLNKIHGVLICTYNAERLAELLNGDVCGMVAGSVILDADLNVIAASSNLSDSMINVAEAFSEYDLAFIPHVEERFVDIYEKQVPSGFDRWLYRVKRFVFIKRMSHLNWFFIQEFPESALHRITTGFLIGSLGIMTQVIGSLLLYIIGTALYHRIRTKMLARQNKIRNYMVHGVSRIFEKFVLLNFEDECYEYLVNTPTDAKVEKQGSFDEIINYFIQIIVDEENRKEFLELFDKNTLQKKLEDDKVYNCSLHVMNPTEYWDTISVMAIEKRDGKVIRALVTNQHVTEMKKKEERDRNALKVALVTAEEANKAKSNFLSNMSHDIRTPMNAIMGFATLIANDAENPDKVRDYTERIKASSEHLLGLINDVLDMSKIESGKVVLTDEVFSVEEIRSGIRDIILPQMEKNKKEFIVTEHNLKVMYYRGDKLRIQQILLNLLSNAIKYTSENGVIKLDIYEQALTQNHRYVNLKYVISDNGIGMDEDFKNHIFESFTRETSSLINKIQGTGLGMAITKSLVDLMNGTISVESRKGVGSTFEVVIPIQIAEKNELQPKENAEGEEDVLKGMKFLVVEDNEINYMVISSLLEMLGAESIHAENGQEAVDMFKKSCKDDFDMIFMDLQMPVMDGLEAARTIRAIDTKWAREVPIIAMTANAYAEDVANALNAGMDAHVAKPIDISILTKTVKKLKKKNN